MTQTEIQAIPGGADSSRFGLRLICIAVLGLMLVVSGSPVATTAAQQDAAEAARQARAQKQSDTTASSHVYTNDDLARQQILTPSDRSRFVAARAPENSSPETQAAANSGSAEDVPLGDVARYYRAQREEQARADARPKTPVLQAKSFQLMASSTPLAAMKQPPVHSASSATSVWPTRKRDPFVHSQLPFVPGSAVIAGANNSNTRTAVSQPAKRIEESVAPAAKPQAARPIVTASISPAKAAPRKTSSILVAEGDTLWSISRRFLGSGTRWKLIVAVNPGLEDPRQLRAGMQLILPAPQL